jgi:hypothetical protein
MFDRSEAQWVYCLRPLSLGSAFITHANFGVYLNRIPERSVFVSGSVFQRSNTAKAFIRRTNGTIL